MIGLTILATISGALFRRVWGGFCAPHAAAKRVAGFALPAAVMLLAGQGAWPTAWVALILGTAWMNGLHAYGQRMGRGGDPALKKCIYAMALSYGFYSGAAAFVWYLAAGHATLALLYAPAGFLAPLGYLLGWELKERLHWPDGGVCLVRVRRFEDAAPNCMIDGPTAIGELWLGGSLLGLLALVAAVVR